MESGLEGISLHPHKRHKQNSSEYLQALELQKGDKSDMESKTNDIQATITSLADSYPGKVEEVKKAGFIFTPRKARKNFISCISHKLIAKGSEYYSVFMAGSGLGGMKRPGRILLSEIDQYCQKYNWSVRWIP